MWSELSKEALVSSGPNTQFTWNGLEQNAELLSKFK